MRTHWQIWVCQNLTLEASDLTLFCGFFFGNSEWRWRISIPIFIVAEEEISGKCQNRKTYLNCSFKRKYQTNTKTKRRTTEENFSNIWRNLQESGRRLKMGSEKEKMGSEKGIDNPALDQTGMILNEWLSWGRIFLTEVFGSTSLELKQLDFLFSEEWSNFTEVFWIVG